jgi:hypothetical protein
MQWDYSHAQGTKSSLTKQVAGTLVSDSPASRPWEIMFCFLSHSNLWKFVSAAWTNITNLPVPLIGILASQENPCLQCQKAPKKIFIVFTHVRVAEPPRLRFWPCSIRKERTPACWNYTQYFKEQCRKVLLIEERYILPNIYRILWELSVILYMKALITY